MKTFLEFINEVKYTKSSIEQYEDKVIQYDAGDGMEEYYVNWATGGKLKMIGKHGSKGDKFEKTISLKYINDNKLKIEIVSDKRPDWSK